MKANGFKSMASSLQNEVDVADVLNEPRMLKTPICQTLIDVIFRTEKPNNTLTIDVLITIDTLRALILGNRATGLILIREFLGLAEMVSIAYSVFLHDPSVERPSFDVVLK